MSRLKKKIQASGHRGSKEKEFIHHGTLGETWAKKLKPEVKRVASVPDEINPTKTRPVWICPPIWMK